SRKRKKKAAINTSRTRAEKAKAQAEYTEVNKQVKRSIRTDKRKYVEDLAMTLEKAAREGNIRQTDDITQKRKKKAAINTSRTRAEKAKAQAEYTEVNKQVKRSIRTDKRKYVEDLATTVEKAAREGNMRQLYDTTKNLSGNHRKPERPVKSKEGKVMTNIEEQRNRWVEHIRQIKSGKAAGPVNIPAEALKADTKSQLYRSLWNNQLNGIHHSTSTSLTTKRHGQNNTLEASSILRRASEDSQYHTEFL
ncbi:unnamed protein product, partial [Schistosoma margrebowiei]